MKTRKKVAVFITELYGNIAREIQAGLNKVALENNIKLIYFTSFSDEYSAKVYRQYEQYDEGDFVSFRIANLKSFDGAVFISFSFTDAYQEKLKELLIDAKIPVIELGNQDDRFYSILHDEVASFRKVVRHVIEEHNMTRIYHLAGMQEKRFVMDRVDAFKDEMEKHGLACPDNHIFYGTLWFNSGELYIDQMLETSRAEGYDFPEAVVCANDFMAIGLINAAKKRGISIPEDFIVTGFDGSEEGKLGNPTLTTVAQNFRGNGEDCIKELISIWEGNEPPRVTLSEGEFITGQSCGYIPMRESDHNEIRRFYTEKLERMEYLTQAITNMSLGISNAETVEGGFQNFQENARIDTGFGTFLLCLIPDWDQNRTPDEIFSQDELMTVVAGKIGDQPVGKQVFQRSHILPDYLMEDEKPYYIFPIHHLQQFMGYLIVSPEDMRWNQIAMKSWVVNLGAVLDNWRIRNQLKINVDRLATLYNRDMLTGLYNRRGYEKFFQELFQSKDDTSLALLKIDMDSLKFVNDNYGHNEGDYSICTIADALKASCKGSEICLRTGGDEFVVLAKGYSELDIQEYISKVRSFIRCKTEQDQKPYPLEVSVGYHYTPSIQADGLNIHEMAEKYLRIADEAMYEEKKKHKEQAK